MSNVHIRHHGAVRGLDNVVSSPLFEGRFGRIFRALPPANFDLKDTDDLKALRDLAGHMVAKAEGDPTPEEANPPDDEENSGISAGYTYLGQFIDHDLTFDPASSLDKQNDPNSLIDYRTPRFDLDSVYGRGPDDQPYLYQPGGLKMQLGRQLTGNPDDPKARDVQRNAPDSGPKRALIGDPRNDENVIVSQLQASFLRFHNRVVDVTETKTFSEAQQIVRWHYQWVVLHDFLPTIIGREMLESILPHLKKQNGSIYEDQPDLRFYAPRNDPFMPVEFSVAAYRFGHSMVRPIYRLNNTLPGRQPIFSPDPTVPSLVGFGEFPTNWAIDWRLFFDFGNNPPKFDPHRIQPAYKIDSSLVDPLGNLPLSVASTPPHSLALRNLLRGVSMGLPSGQAVAKAMCLPVIHDKDLRVGKATEADNKKNILLTDISQRFVGNAPLWYYILAEAQQHFKKNSTPIHLGPVGGRIVGEVFVGLLLGDKHSFLSQDPCWTPRKDFTRDGKFGMAELLDQAKQA
jgi:Animal haem peroxidase